MSIVDSIEYYFIRKLKSYIKKKIKIKNFNTIDVNLKTTNIIYNSPYIKTIA